MLKRKIQKVTNALKNLFRSGKGTKKLLFCKDCDEVEVEVASDIKAVTCAYCVQRQVAPPDNIKPKAVGEKFPRGWALKLRYVHTDGRVFTKGKDTGEVITSEPKTPKESIKKTVSKKKKVAKKTPKRRK